MTCQDAPDLHLVSCPVLLHIGILQKIMLHHEAGAMYWNLASM
eukprot:CAMPEP_0202354450 /NCGR_PEP_ID=MMETSP1126-20121109/9763_1 /ASSEMBLY_ACC=CAM_ASM_000457 /TAXON_ID=3047 /ORGANISM="Dunaliella tertiolecta, Strain CCMP1320" /LENGTH=42 /DNA_ID= /DNA_START= /DNA_END= /DNA_ORIENTATION=